jgi:hypothetical protein
MPPCFFTRSITSPISPVIHSSLFFPVSGEIASHLPLYFS